MKVFLVFFIGLVVAPLLCQEPMSVDEVKAVRLCDLFDDLLKWNGRMVRVTGTVEGGGGFWLTGIDCRAVLRQGTVTFQNVIALANPDDPSRIIHKQEVTFTWDIKNWLRLEKLVENTPKMQKIVGTVVGLYETRRTMEDLFGRLGRPAGLGPQNIAPAQIVVKEVDDIKVVPK